MKKARNQRDALPFPEGRNSRRASYLRRRRGRGPGKLVEHPHERQRVGRAKPLAQLVEPILTSVSELVVSKPWWLGVGSVFRLPGGFDSGCSFLAARLNQLLEVVKSVEPILTSVSERVVLTPSCGCRNVAAGFVRYDFYITSSPMWMGLLATSPLMCCMSSVRSSVASGVAGSQEVAV